MDLESKRPSGPLFRVGRDDDAWAAPDWAYAKEDGTFGKSLRCLFCNHNPYICYGAPLRAVFSCLHCILLIFRLIVR